MPRKKSPELRAIDWPQIIETALTAPGNVGNTYNRFYEYSFLNQMYLLMQGVHEPVATYKRWRAIGRQVLTGHKKKEIIRPVILHKKPRAEKAQEPSEPEETDDTFVSFKPVKCLITLSDTIGDDLPPVQLPEWDFDAALDKLGIRLVPFTALNGNVQGFARDRDIAMNPLAVHPTKTRFHEIGHVVLGHTAPDTLAEYEQHRGIMEFQAEATAYLTMNELERLDEATATRSRGYIQGWLQNERPPDKAIRQVFVATDQILRAGRIATGNVVQGGLDL